MSVDIVLQVKKNFTVMCFIQTTQNSHISHRNQKSHRRMSVPVHLYTVAEESALT